MNRQFSEQINENQNKNIIIEKLKQDYNELAEKSLNDKNKFDKKKIQERIDIDIFWLWKISYY